MGNRQHTLNQRNIVLTRRLGSLRLGFQSMFHSFHDIYVILLRYHVFPMLGQSELQLTKNLMLNHQKHELDCLISYLRSILASKCSRKWLKVCKSDLSMESVSLFVCFKLFLIKVSQQTKLYHKESIQKIH